jgi:hypothetical protein
VEAYYDLEVMKLSKCLLRFEHFQEVERITTCKSLCHYWLKAALVFMMAIPLPSFLLPCIITTGLDELWQE